MAATVQGETAAAAGRLGSAPVHKEVTKKINSELVPVCFQIQKDKDMNKTSLRATILPVLGSKKQVNGGCRDNALWFQKTNTCKVYKIPAAPHPLGLNSFHPPQSKHPVLTAHPRDGAVWQHTLLCLQLLHDLTSNDTHTPTPALVLQGIPT